MNSIVFSKAHIVLRQRANYGIYQVMHKVVQLAVGKLFNALPCDVRGGTTCSGKHFNALPCDVLGDIIAPLL